jgi:hypothetical protein
VCGAFGTFAHQAYTARLRGQLSSNVRPHKQTMKFFRVFSKTWIATIALALAAILSPSMLPQPPVQLGAGCIWCVIVFPFLVLLPTLAAGLLRTPTRAFSLDWMFLVMAASLFAALLASEVFNSANYRLDDSVASPVRAEVVHVSHRRGSARAILRIGPGAMETVKVTLGPGSIYEPMLKVRSVVVVQVHSGAFGRSWSSGIYPV